MERRHSFDNSQPRGRPSRRDAAWFLRGDRSQSVPPERRFEAYNAFKAIKDSCTRITNELQQFEREVNDHMQNQRLLSQEKLNMYQHLVSNRRAYDDRVTAFENTGHANYLKDDEINILRLGNDTITTIRERIEPQVARLAYESLRRERENIIQDLERLAGGMANHIQQDIQQDRLPPNDLINSFMEMAARSQTYTNHAAVFNNSEHAYHLPENQVRQMINEAGRVAENSSLIARTARLLTNYHAENATGEQPILNKKRRLE